MDDTVTLDGELVKELSEFAAVRESVSLSSYTTFTTGGPADYLIEPFTESDISPVIRLLQKSLMPVTVIGGGSNLLVSDKGIRGSVVRIASDVSSPAMMKRQDELVYVSAFMRKEDFIEASINSNLDGVQFIAGVPGTVGGGIAMNAGTYMGTFADITNRICYVTSNGEFHEIEPDASMTGYRKLVLEKGAVITGAWFTLTSRSGQEVRNEVEAIIADRASKHPYEYPSAGSVFKNPEGHSSWKLVNDAGLKGEKIGGAMVSQKHTNFIINTGNATSLDIYMMIRRVQERVMARFGVSLETEIRMLGEFPEE